MMDSREPMMMNSEPGWAVTISRVISAFIIVIGAFVLIAWSFYYWMPVGSMRQLLSIQPNEAMCFVLSGIVLWVRISDFIRIFFQN
jgi:hypothetical protein